jgi:hypothetical protein
MYCEHPQQNARTSTIKLHEDGNLTSKVSSGAIFNISQPYRPPLPVTRIALLFLLNFSR